MTSLLDEYNSTQSKGNNLPYLKINISTEDNDGNSIPPKTFNIEGTTEYTKSINIRPLLYFNKLMQVKQDKNGAWKTLNETILYRGGEQPIDSKGGIACGRLLGKAIPSGWSPEQIAANKAKAAFYGFLVGLVKDGENEVLVTLRLPASKSFQMSQKLQELAAKSAIYTYELKLTLKQDPKNKTSQHPIIDIDVAKEGLGMVDVEFEKQAINWVKDHNARIIKSHKDVLSMKSGKALVEDITGDDLNDEIAF